MGIKQRFFPLILSFTMLAVVATAVNCGCAFAKMTVAHQKTEPAMAHCDQHQEAAKESEECCVGCKLEQGALNSRSVDFQLQRSNDLLSQDLLSPKIASQIISKHPISSRQFHGFEARGVSIPSFDLPTYIVLESFLI